jgi:hypothetical protein
MGQPLYEVWGDGMRNTLIALAVFAALIGVSQILPSADYYRSRDYVFHPLGVIVFVGAMAVLVGSVITGIRERRTLRAARERQPEA